MLRKLSSQHSDNALQGLVSPARERLAQALLYAETTTKTKHADATMAAASTYLAGAKRDLQECLTAATNGCKECSG
jgi:hypothetical protein